jgi:hypothetical protein
VQGLERLKTGCSWVTSTKFQDVGTYVSFVLGVQVSSVSVSESSGFARWRLVQCVTGVRVLDRGIVKLLPPTAKEYLCCSGAYYNLQYSIGA